MPEAVTKNVALWPEVMVWLVGCVVMEGATAAAFTVTVALALVAFPTEFETTTLNCAPLFEVDSVGVV